MKSHLDLRCSRRITVAEGRTILEALGPDGHDRLRAKLLTAITMATHKCDKLAKGRCSVCGMAPAAVARIRERRAKDFRDTLAKSKDDQKKREMAAKEAALMERPALKFPGVRA